MKRGLLTILLILVNTLIIIVNVRGAMQGYYNFYEKKELLSKNPIYCSLDFVDESVFWNTILTYTGFETGYGFFAPNVASDFITMITLLDNKNQVLKKINFIELNNKESYIRMFSGYSMFLNYKYKDTLSMEYQKCNIFLKSIGQKSLKQNPNSKTAIIDLYLFHYPTLAQLKNKTLISPNYIFFTRKKVSRNEQNWIF